MTGPDGEEAVLAENIEENFYDATGLEPETAYTFRLTASYGENTVSGVPVTVTTQNYRTGTVYRALLVGQVHFQYASEECPDSIGDLNLMGNMLQHVEGPQGSAYSITRKTDLTVDQVHQAIQTTFADADEDDVSLFFIATHGLEDDYLEEEDIGALICYNPSTRRNEYIKDTTLAAWLSEIPGEVVVILEACSSGSAIYDSGEENASGNGVTLSAMNSAAISQAVSACEEYGIDGLNVDIENITPEKGEDFIEFIRELCIEAHKKGLYVSVDNYVPYNFNDYYHLDEQGRFADYIVLMGYDEHYAGSQEAGSVASIDYVTYGIGEALKEVPADKLINAIPFYTRIWTTSPEGVSSQAVTMAYCQEFMKEHGMKPEWSDSFGQYYAEAREGDNYYQIWVEGKKSIELKLRVMQEYALAGVAEWCLGFETPEIWDVIEAYMKQ